MYCGYPCTERGVCTECGGRAFLKRVVYYRAPNEYLCSDCLTARGERDTSDGEVRGHE